MLTHVDTGNKVDVGEAHEGEAAKLNEELRFLLGMKKEKWVGCGMHLQRKQTGRTRQLHQTEQERSRRNKVMSSSPTFTKPISAYIREHRS